MARFLAAGILMLSFGAAAARPTPGDVNVDRARANRAGAEVTADAKVVDSEVQRVAALKVAWDLAVADGHAIDAGHFAKAHFEAMAAQRRAEDALRTARRTFEAAREQLRSDESKRST